MNWKIVLASAGCLMVVLNCIDPQFWKDVYVAVEVAVAFLGVLICYIIEDSKKEKERYDNRNEVQRRG